jgi:hypothetical protein
MTFFKRSSLCVALISGFTLVGCSSLPNQTPVSQSGTSSMHILTTKPVNHGAQWVDQIGNFNDVIIDNPANPIWLRQIGNFNFADVDDLNGPLRVNQIGNFNAVHDEEEE